MELGSHFVHSAVGVSQWPPTLSLLLGGWGMEEGQCGSQESSELLPGGVAIGTAGEMNVANGGSG